jgi:dTDP-4-dehydrorhamnose reductase
MNKRVLLLGANGMLGRYVHKYLNEHNIEVYPITRKDADLSQDNFKIYIPFDLSDYIIVNCAGIIKSRKDVDPTEYIKVNSLIPHKLQELAESAGTKLIHITTDCVFNGLKPIIRNDEYYDGYLESDTHTPEDVYGKTKSLGEPENACNIRTSIIGEELENKRSLIEWVKSNKQGKISGYNNHFWNGITCLQLAKVIHTIIDQELYWKGVRHIFTPGKPCTKYLLLDYINYIYDLDIVIDKVNDRNYEHLNRTLKSNFKENKIFNIPDIQKQIEEQAEYSNI